MWCRWLPTAVNPKLESFFGNVLLYTMNFGSSPKICKPCLLIECLINLDLLCTKKRKKRRKKLERKEHILLKSVHFVNSKCLMKTQIFVAQKGFILFINRCLGRKTWDANLQVLKRNARPLWKEHLQTPLHSALQENVGNNIMLNIAIILK